MVRGIRGAITVKQNNSEEILSATAELLTEIVRVNNVKEEDIAAIFFSVTADLDAAFPAEAARIYGWKNTPLFCSAEINVPGSLPSCIRVLFLVNTLQQQTEVKHIYLREAVVLREDINNK